MYLYWETPPSVAWFKIFFYPYSNILKFLIQYTVTHCTASKITGIGPIQNMPYDGISLLNEKKLFWVAPCFRQSRNQ